MRTALRIWRIYNCVNKCLSFIKMFVTLFSIIRFFPSRDGNNDDENCWTSVKNACSLLYSNFSYVPITRSSNVGSWQGWRSNAINTVHPSWHVQRPGVIGNRRFAARKCCLYIPLPIYSERIWYEYVSLIEQLKIELFTSLDRADHWNCLEHEQLTQTGYEWPCIEKYPVLVVQRE